MLKKSLILTIMMTTAISTAKAEGNNEDWLESYNRNMFEINYQFDKYTLKPAAKGYRAVTTQGIRDSVNDFLSNIVDPIRGVNFLLQGDLPETANSFGRFVVNTTLGIGGLFDVAEGWGLKKKKTNFDMTLAKYCVPDGPYIILPLLGPSTPRAAFGYGVDAMVSPVYWATRKDANVVDKVSFSYGAIHAIAAREQSMDFLDDLEKNSVDFYATTKSAYMQNRQQIKSFCSPKAQQPSYDFSFDDEDEN